MTSVEGTSASSESISRPQTLFEDYPGCPQLGPPEVQSLDKPGVLASLRLKDRSLTRWLVGAALRLSGFHRFSQSDELEHSLAVDRGWRPVPCPLFSAAVPLADEPQPSEPCDRGARLLGALWDTHADLRAGRFEPDRHRGRALESRGYLNLFGTRFEFDGRSFRVGKTSETTRLLVCSRGHQYVVDLSLPPTAGASEGLARTLRGVWEESGKGPVSGEVTVGGLSGAAQSTQRAGFERLLATPENRARYACVTSCFAVICLDLETAPGSPAEAARAALVGNPHNRWFHASLQVVVFGNGRVCLVCNPDAGLTGNAMMRAATELHRRSMPPVADDTHRTPLSSTPQRIDWAVGDLPGEQIDADLAEMRDDQPATFEVPFGRRRARELGLAPIELFVAGVHRAVFGLTGESVSISQFVGATGFRCGSHATAVVSTAELDRFREAVDRPAEDATAVRRAFALTVDAQRDACAVARSGVPLPAALSLFRATRVGWQRRYVAAVLGGLLRILIWLGLEDESHGHDVVLSHPTIAPAAPMVGRPGVRLPYLRCFGLHYQVHDDRTVFTIMPGRSWQVPNAELADAIDTSLDELLTRLGGQEQGLGGR